MENYNCSVIIFKNEKPEGIFLAEVKQDLILLCNFIKFTGMDGTIEFDKHIRSMHERLEIAYDGGKKYKQAIYGGGISV